MNSLWLIKIVALSGFASVALGAFGAHGLKNSLSEQMLAVYQTGVQYQIYHTLALLGLAILMHSFPKNSWLMFSAIGFCLGIMLFSGSLYILSLSGIKWLGAITPLGGLAFLAGWACLFISTLQMK